MQQSNRGAVAPRAWLFSEEDENESLPRLARSTSLLALPPPCQSFFSGGLIFL